VEMGASGTLVFTLLTDDKVSMPRKERMERL